MNYISLPGEGPGGRNLSPGRRAPYTGAVRVRTKRIYEPRGAADGTRILVMGFWPRGIRKGRVDEWNRDVAPSKELVFAFKRHGLPWRRYVRRFRAELRPAALEALRRRKGTITLL